ncbi:MAG: PEP-CTERM sorting domain-containing protein [Pseudomonadota bacterium]
MHKLGIALLGGLMWVSQGVAAGQDVTGIACTTGGLTLVTGAAFNASCTGGLRIDASSIIKAEESITLRAAGNIWMLGTLIAPRIELVAESYANVAGGLFSGSPDFYPDVNAVSYAGSLTASSRNFHDLVPRAYIDPVFGAAEARIGSSATVKNVHINEPIVASADFLTLPLLDFTLEETASPVPEPSHLALFAAGLGLIAWKRRSGHHLSHAAHKACNPKVTLEN